MADEEKVSELLAENCPFCGEAPELVEVDGGVVIRCRNTQCFGPSTPTYGYADAATVAWNRRPTPVTEDVGERRILGLMTARISEADPRVIELHLDQEASTRELVYLSRLITENDHSWPASPSQPKAGEVSVKLLEWRQATTYSYADTPFGEYTVQYYSENDGSGWQAILGDTCEIGYFPTDLIACSACQADYEARIRSALVTIKREG